MRTDPDHGEYWSARDLFPVLGYEKWERFEGVIERARAATVNIGQDPDLHFSRIREDRTGLGGAPRANYRLTRFGAYLVAMNGDPHKEEIARAQAYFAIKAREAEAGERGDLRAYIRSVVREELAEILRTETQPAVLPELPAPMASNDAAVMRTVRAIRARLIKAGGPVARNDLRRSLRNGTQRPNFDTAIGLLVKAEMVGVEEVTLYGQSVRRYTWRKR